MRCMKYMLLFMGAFFAHAAFAQTVTLSAPYRTYPTFYNGDSFVITISGAAASSSVQISAWQNSTSLGTTSYGNTDGSGFKEVRGQLVINGHIAIGRRFVRANPSGFKIGTVTTEVWTAPDIGLPILIKQKSPTGENCSAIRKHLDWRPGQPVVCCTRRL